MLKEPMMCLQKEHCSMSLLLVKYLWFAADWQDVFCSPKDLAGEDYVRPPLPVKREALYEDIFHYR
jgi:hypothetical protein